MPHEMDRAPDAEPADAAGEGVDATPEAEAPEDPFETMVFAALDALPDVFRERLGSVAVVIEDEPTADQLSATGAWGLLGLYTGVPRTAWGAENAAIASKIAPLKNGPKPATRVSA
jgi:predicted Zn-dependent protease with MMP-like domain